MLEVPISSIRIDGGTQPRASLDDTVIQDYAQDMLLGVVFPPVTLFYDGVDYWLADGFHRYHGAQQICREAIDAEIKQGTRRDAVLYSVGTNATHGVRRTNADKRRAVETLLNDLEWAKWSNREIARRCGVDEGFVRKLREQSSADYPQIERKVERNGTVYTMNTAGIGQQQNLTPQQFLDEVFPGFTEQKLDNRVQKLERWQEDNIELGLDKWGDVPSADQEAQEEIPVSSIHPLERPLYQSFVQAVTPNTPTISESWKLPPDLRGTDTPTKSTTLTALQSSESNEWFTPAQYIDAARHVMGGIDLDPASNEFANCVVQATIYYDIETNGLDKPWHGRIWLNPPYGRDIAGSNQEVWSHRLLEQYQQGITKEAILLVNANTEAKWFQPFYDYLICFTHHRIRFYNTDGTPSQPTQGNAFIYFGPQQDRFVDVFQQFGVVVKRVK